MAVHIRKARTMRLLMVSAQRGGISSSQISPYQKGGLPGETGKSTISTHKPEYHIKRPTEMNCSKSAMYRVDTFLQVENKRHSIHSMAATPR